MTAPGSKADRICRVHSLGLVSYREGLELQYAGLAEVAAGGEERISLQVLDVIYGNVSDDGT